MKRTRVVSEPVREEADLDENGDDDVVTGSDFLDRLGHVNGSPSSTFGIQAGESMHKIIDPVFDRSNPWPQRDGVLVETNSDGEIVPVAPNEEDFGFSYRDNVFQRQGVIENDRFSQFLTVLAGEIGEETTEVLYDAESIKDQRNYEGEMRRLEEYERKRIENGTVEKEDALKRQDIEIERLGSELNGVRDTHRTLTALLSRMTPFTIIVPKDNARLSSYYLCDLIVRQYQFVTRLAKAYAKAPIKPDRLSDEAARTYETLFISQKGNPTLLRNEGAKFQLDQAKVLVNRNFSGADDYKQFLCLLWRALYIRDVLFPIGTVANVYVYDVDTGRFDRQISPSTMRWSITRLFDQTTRDLVALAIQSNKLLSVVMATHKPVLISRVRYMEQLQLLNDQIISKNRLLSASQSDAERVFYRTAIADIEKKRDDLVTAHSKFHEEVDKNVDIALTSDETPLDEAVATLFVEALQSQVAQLTVWMKRPSDERDNPPLFGHFMSEDDNATWTTQLKTILVARAMSMGVESVESIVHTTRTATQDVVSPTVSAHLTSFLIATIDILAPQNRKSKAVILKTAAPNHVEVTLVNLLSTWENAMNKYRTVRTDTDRTDLDRFFLAYGEKVTVTLKLKNDQNTEDFIQHIHDAAGENMRRAFHALVLEKDWTIYAPMPQFKDNPTVFELMQMLRSMPVGYDPAIEIAQILKKKKVRQETLPVSHLALESFQVFVAPRLLGFISCALVFFLRDMDTGVRLGDEALANLVAVFNARSTTSLQLATLPRPSLFKNTDAILFNYQPNRSLLDKVDTLSSIGKVPFVLGALNTDDFNDFNAMQTHLTSRTSPFVSSVLKEHPSLKLIFNAIFWNNRLYAPREREISDRREETQRSAESLRRQILKIFQSEPKGRRERMKELKQLYVPSAQWQMQPMLTGILRLSSRTVAALENGLQLTRTWVDSLQNATLDELTQSNMDSGLPGAFARLVAALWNRTSLIHAHTYNKDIQYKLDPQIRKESLDALRGFHVRKNALGQYVAHRQHPTGGGRPQPAFRGTGSGASNVTVYYL